MLTDVWAQTIRTEISAFSTGSLIAKIAWNQERKQARSQWDTDVMPTYLSSTLKSDKVYLEAFFFGHLVWILNISLGQLHLSLGLPKSSIRDFLFGLDECSICDLQGFIINLVNIFSRIRPDPIAFHQHIISKWMVGRFHSSLIFFTFQIGGIQN